MQGTCIETPKRVPFGPAVAYTAATSRSQKLREVDATDATFDVAKMPTVGITAHKLDPPRPRCCVKLTKHQFDSFDNFRSGGVREPGGADASRFLRPATD